MAGVLASLPYRVRPAVYVWGKLWNSYCTCAYSH